MSAWRRREETALGRKWQLEMGFRVEICNPSDPAVCEFCEGGRSFPWCLIRGGLCPESVTDCMQHHIISDQPRILVSIHRNNFLLKYPSTAENTCLLRLQEPATTPKINPVDAVRCM